MIFGVKIHGFPKNSKIQKKTRNSAAFPLEFSNRNKSLKALIFNTFADFRKNMNFLANRRGEII